MSSCSPLVDISVDNSGIATLTMQKQPVNSLSLDMIQDLIKALDEIENQKYKGVVLTSCLPKVFSAGLDLKEIYKPDLKRAEIFYVTFLELCTKLLGSKFITAAAINGHAPAGACILAMTCEYRVMIEGNFTIGLNEAKIGLILNKWIIQLMRDIIPVRQAELAITTAKMFSVDEALKVGLIDESVKNAEAAMTKCKDFIKQFDNIPQLARIDSKLKIKERPLTLLQNNSSEGISEFLKYINKPSVQNSLEEYINKIKQRKISGSK